MRLHNVSKMVYFFNLISMTGFNLISLTGFGLIEQAPQAVAAFDEELPMVEVNVDQEASMSEWRNENQKKRKNKHIVESPKNGRKVKRKDDGIKAGEIRSKRKCNLVAKAKTSKKEYGSGMHKPIEISSNSKKKFEKKVREKKLEKRMEKKMDKRHLEGLRRLNSRMSPAKMSLAVRSLKKAQKEQVKKWV